MKIPEWIGERLSKIPREKLHVFSCRELAGGIDWGYVLCDFEIETEVKIDGKPYRLVPVGFEHGRWAYQIGRC